MKRIGILPKGDMESELVELLTADEYAEMNQKRLQYAARMKEIKTLLADSAEA